MAGRKGASSRINRWNKSNTNSTAGEYGKFLWRNTMNKMALRFAKTAWIKLFFWLKTLYRYVVYGTSLWFLIGSVIGYKTDTNELCLLSKCAKVSKNQSIYDSMILLLETFWQILKIISIGACIRWRCSENWGKGN